MRGDERNVEATMTLDEWAALDEDASGELVDGHLEEEEVASFVHELVVAWLIRVVGSWVAERGGFVFGSDAKFGVAPARGRKPDISVFLAGRRPPPKGLSRIPPDIAIEVVTDTPADARRDRIDKLADYATFGVRWYWLVDPALRSIEILELGDDKRYAHALDAANGRVDVPACSGLTLDLDALWSEVDALTRPRG